MTVVLNTLEVPREILITKFKFKPYNSSGRKVGYETAEFNSYENEDFRKAHFYSHSYNIAATQEYPNTY